MKMKKIGALLIVLCLFLFCTSISFSQENTTCNVVAGGKYFVPKGKLFVMYHVTGPNLFQSEGFKVTVLKIHREPNSGKSGKYAAEFDVSYDKPLITCIEHGVDTYDMYKHNLNDRMGRVGFVRTDYLKCEDK